MIVLKSCFLSQIWFAHKHVCRANSNPFHFPPLTAEEVEEAQRRDGLAPHRNSISGGLHSFLGIPAQQSKARLLFYLFSPSLTLTSHPVQAFLIALTDKGGHGSLDDAASAIRAWVRAMLSVKERRDWAKEDYFCDVVTKPSFPSTLYQAHGLAAYIAFFSTLTGDRGGDFVVSWEDYREPFGNPCFSRFFHLVLTKMAIYQLICQKSHGRAGATLEQSPYFPYLRQVQQQLDKHVGTTASRDSRAAARMRRGIEGFPDFFD